MFSALTFSDIKVYLIVCPLVFLAGFVDSIGGGGGLISIPAYLMAGLPVRSAVGTNKFMSSCGTTVATVRFCRNGYADWRLAVPGIAAALLGAQAGSRAAMHLDARVFKIMLIAALPVIAVLVLRKRAFTEEKRNVPFRRQLLISVLMTFLLGIYDGLYGPGTGTFLILVYTSLAGMDLLAAEANTKLANLASNISALSVYLMNGCVLFPLAIAAALCNMAGNYVGSGLAIRNGSRYVRPVIIAVLALLFIKVILELGGIV